MQKHLQLCFTLQPAFPPSASMIDISPGAGGGHCAEALPGMLGSADHREPGAGGAVGAFQHATNQGQGGAGKQQMSVTAREASFMGRIVTVQLTQKCPLTFRLLPGDLLCTYPLECNHPQGRMAFTTCLRSPARWLDLSVDTATEHQPLRLSAHRTAATSCSSSASGCFTPFPSRRTTAF